MVKEKKEKVLILGGSGTGKDYLLRGLIKKGLRYEPKFTTRPKRLLETNGIDYDFITNQDFKKLEDQGDIKVFQSFLINNETWYYGITKENFNKNQVFIITPEELLQLEESDIKSSFIVYLDIDIDIRRDRIKGRNDNNDSIERRIMADVKDFESFNRYDLKITDPDFDPEWVYDLMD